MVTSYHLEIVVMLIKTQTGQTFYIDSDALAAKVLEQAKKYEDIVIILPNKVKIDLSRKSLGRTALRQLATFIIIPFLEYAASLMKRNLRPKIKHEDPIIYAIEAYAEVLKVMTYDLILIANDEEYSDEIRIINSFTTEKELPLFIPLPIEIKSE
jgi:hypothetical protein